MTEVNSQHSYTVVVVGASGDLAKKKTYPALFALYSNSLLPENTLIYGYARSELSDEKFRESITPRYEQVVDKGSGQCTVLFRLMFFW